MHSFYVYGGNFPLLIVQALIRRGVWILIYIRNHSLSRDQLAQNVVEKCDFIWKPINTPDLQGYIEQRLYTQNPKVNPFIFNHFQSSSSIGVKSNLIKSLDNYYTFNKSARAARFSTFDITPVTYILSYENRE